ncbi:MPSF protein, partial [Polypterus senegalus]
MAAKVLPFYQRKLKHYDQGYRSTQTRYVVQEYSASSSRTASSRSSASRVASTSQASRAQVGTKRHRTSVEDEQLEYTVPPFRTRSAAEQEEYQRRVVHFGNELASLEAEVHEAREATRQQVDKLAVQRMVSRIQLMGKGGALCQGGDAAPQSHKIANGTSYNMLCVELRWSVTEIRVRQK